jgi:uncharacterized membrane protein YqjE
MRPQLVRDTAPHRSVGELLNELTDGGTQLVRDEIRLARAETVESLLTLRRGVVWLGIGAAVALFATGAAVAALVMLLSRYLLDGRTWLAALVVTVVLGAIALLCAWRGRSALSAASLAPRETATSLKETAAWLKHPTRSVAR